jgi:hypothetical protein
MRLMEPVPDDLQAALARAVEEEAGAFGAKVSEVSYDRDSDGDDWLNVVIDYDRPDTPIDPGMVAGMDRRLFETARRLGERRLIYIRNRFDDSQRVVQARSRFA